VVVLVVQCDLDNDVEVCIMQHHVIRRVKSLDRSVESCHGLWNHVTVVDITVGNSFLDRLHPSVSLQNHLRIDGIRSQGCSNKTV